MHKGADDEVQQRLAQVVAGGPGPALQDGNARCGLHEQGCRGSRGVPSQRQQVRLSQSRKAFVAVLDGCGKGRVVARLRKQGLGATGVQAAVPVGREAGSKSRFAPVPVSDGRYHGVLQPVVERLMELDQEACAVRPVLIEGALAAACLSDDLVHAQVCQVGVQVIAQEPEGRVEQDLASRLSRPRHAMWSECRGRPGTAGRRAATPAASRRAADGRR